MKLQRGDGQVATYVIRPGVQHWRRLRIGDEIDASISNALTVYVPDASSVLDKSHPPDARVLLTDRSYRLLTLQYASGTTDTFKVAIREHLPDIPPGSWVRIRPLEVLDLHARRDLAQDAGACSIHQGPSSP